MDKKTIAIISLFIVVFFGGFISRGLLNRSTIRELENGLTASADRIGEYQADLGRIAARLGESEKTLEAERDTNKQHIEDLDRIQTELAESQRRNRELTEAVGNVQEGLGGIAGRANSGSGIIDGCLQILKTARDS